MPQWCGMRPNLMSRPKPKRMWPYARLTTMLSVKLLRPSLGGVWVRVYRSIGANGFSPSIESGVLPSTRLSSASIVAWTLTVSVMCRVGSMRRRMLADPKPLRRPHRRVALLELMPRPSRPPMQLASLPPSAIGWGAPSLVSLATAGGGKNLLSAEEFWP